MLMIPLLKATISAAKLARLLAFLSASALALLSPVASRGQVSGPLAPVTPSDQPVASAAAPSQSSVNRIGGKPNLSGTWKLNKDQSDDPRVKTREAAQDSGNNPDASQSNPGGGWGGPGGPGGFGYPGGQGRGPYGGPNAGLGGPYSGPNGDPNAGPNGYPNGNPNNGPNAGPNGQSGSNGRNGAPRQDEFAQLTIEQTPTAARVADASGRLLAAYAATPQDAPAPNADSGGSNGNRRNWMGPAVAQWQGDQLVATNQMGRVSMTRTFELSPNGRQLIVTTKTENQRSNAPVTYRDVYDPVTVSNDDKNR